MAEPEQSLEYLLAALVKRSVKEAVSEALNQQRIDDRLLDAKEAAKLLSVSEDWLYRNAKKLPFSRKLGPKMLRFSQAGIKNIWRIRIDIYIAVRYGSRMPKIYRKEGTPKKTMIYLEVDVFERLRKIAFKERISMAEIIRRALDDYLKIHPKKGGKKK